MSSSVDCNSQCGTVTKSTLLNEALTTFASYENSTLYTSSGGKLEQQSVQLLGNDPVSASSQSPSPKADEKSRTVRILKGPRGHRRHPRPYCSSSFRPEELYARHQRLRCETYKTRQSSFIHFQTCYALIEELFEKIRLPLEFGFKFLDIACAPGGFSQYLLDGAGGRAPCREGYGVTLPDCLGGFQVLVTQRCPSSPYHILYFDLLSPPFVALPELPHGSQLVDIAIADAQYLAGKEFYQTPYLGNVLPDLQRAKLALLLNQFRMALSWLENKGTFIFRFSAYTALPENWYRLLMLCLDLFEKVQPFKSEYVHCTDTSFYIVCQGFRRSQYLLNGVAQSLDESYAEVFNRSHAKRRSRFSQHSPREPVLSPTSHQGAISPPYALATSLSPSVLSSTPPLKRPWPIHDDRRMQPRSPSSVSPRTPQQLPYSAPFITRDAPQSNNLSRNTSIPPYIKRALSLSVSQSSIKMTDSSLPHDTQTASITSAPIPPSLDDEIDFPSLIPSKISRQPNENNNEKVSSPPFPSVIIGRKREHSALGAKQKHNITHPVSSSASENSSENANTVDTTTITLLDAKASFPILPSLYSEVSDKSWYFLEWKSMFEYVWKWISIGESNALRAWHQNHAVRFGVAAPSTTVPKHDKDGDTYGTLTSSDSSLVPSCEGQCLACD